MHQKQTKLFQNSAMHKIHICMAVFSLWCCANIAAQEDRVYLPFDLSKGANILQPLPVIFAKYLYYPPTALQAKRGGFGVVSIVIEKDGSISNLRVLKAPDSLCAALLTSIILTHAAKWNAAEANGHPVRQNNCFMFYFHPVSATVYFIGYGSPRVNNYAELEALTPSEYYKYNATTDSKALRTPNFKPLQIPPAAKAAHLNAEVAVAYEVDPQGVLKDARALNDPGYGCAEAAMEFVSQRKYWIPKCHYDTCFTQQRIDKVVFCTDSAALIHSNSVVEESALRDYPIENTYELYRDFSSKLRTGFVQADMVVEKNGTLSAVSLESDGKDTLLMAEARKWMSKLKMPVPLFCGLPCRVHLVRYLYFHCGEGRNHWGKMLVHSPALKPPPDFERLYKPEETDQPVTYTYGSYGLQQLHRNIWKYPENALKQGIQGTVVVRVEVTTSANTYTNVISGIGGGCDEDAQQIILRTGFSWNPALVDGYRVKSYLDVPIPFWIKKE